MTLAPERSDTATLVELIEDLRAELEAEIPMRLHDAHGSIGAEYASTAARRTNGQAIGWTGLPFAPDFARYLDRQHGYEFIAADSLGEIGGYCRATHDESHAVCLHRDAHPAAPGECSSSLCRHLAVAVVELRQPLSFAAASESITVFAARKLLLDVLAHAETWRAQRRARAMAHDTADEPPSLPEMLHRQHDERRERKVWHLLRLRYRDLPPWEIERGRRAEQHRKLGCQPCGLAVA